MPTHLDYMRSFRRVTQRVAPAFAAVASVFLFATCDFDKISSTPSPITQQDLNRLFSITPASDSLLTLGASLTLGVTPGPGIDLTTTTKRWKSNGPSIASVDSLTGLVTGIGIGATTIVARLLAPELDTGYAKTHAIRVRFKAIKVATIDSITGLNLSRPVVVSGTNNADAIVGVASGATISTHDSGSTANTIAAAVGSAVFARKNGIAYVVGLFDGFRDSTKIKIRQVAKNILFPTTEYTAHALNANRTIPITIRDVNDSIMTSSPVMRWRTSDTTAMNIDSLTGVFSMKKLDTARIFVRVDTVTRSQKILMDQVVATVAKVATTDAQSDTVGQQLPLAPSVTVLDSGSTPVVGASVTFRAATRIGLIVDSVKTTDSNGQATLGSWTLGDTVGTYTVIATSGIASATFTATAVPDRPFGLRFSQQPSLAGANDSIAPAVKVTIVDSLGNAVTDATNTITIALGNNPGAATLSGTVSVAAVAGVATFDALMISAAGSAYTLEATATGLTGVISNAFDVFGSATQLAFSVQPSDVTIGTTIKPAIKVAVQDAAGTTVATSTHSVTLALANNPGSAILGGTLTQAAVGGIATFSNVTLDAIANGYTLTATATGVTSATSAAFNTRAVGSVAKVGIIVEPADVTAGANITPGIQVELQDATGARVTTATHTIRLSFATNAGGGSLTGTNDISTSAGVATFNSLSIDRAGTGYKLLASVVNFGFGTDTTVAFNVSAGAATKLGYLEQPTHVNPNSAMSTPVRVAIQDALGNTLTSTPATNVAVALGGGTVGATLGGTATQQTSSGVATFTGLTVNTAGTGYFLTATSGTLQQVLSTGFNAVAASGGALKLRFVGTPSSSGANSTLTSVQVELIDNAGARVTTTGTQITMSIGSGPGSLFGTFTANTATGIATFTNLRIQKSGAYTLAANATGFPTATSPQFTVAAGTAQGTSFLTPLSSLVAGATITPALKVGIVDAFDNVVPSASSNITLSYNFSPFGAAPLAGSLTKSTTDGVATFDDIVISTVGNGYQLFAGNSSGFSGAFSPFFDVVAGTPVGLAFEVQPGSSINAGDEISPSIKVKIQDAGGNPVASATNSITLALTGGDAAATLAGTKTVSPSGGVATFAGMSVDKPGTGYRLSASASGFTTVSSNAFTVNLGFATKLKFTAHPSNITGGGNFSVTVNITDNAGNLITNSDRTIFLNILSGSGTSGAVLSGTTSQFSSGGIATFNNLSVDKIGTAYKIEATASFGLTAESSNAFDVTQGPAAKLLFTVQPTQTNGGATITPAVKVSITDLGGNVVTGAANLVTIAKTSGTGSGTAVLSGTLSQTAVAGVATFSNLSIDKAANFYSLTATATGLAAATSSSFNVIIGPTAKLVFTFTPTSVVSMNTFTVNVAVTDAGGNTITTASDAVNLAIATQPGGATLGGVPNKTASSGTASFTLMTLDKAGTYTFSATATGLTAGTSPGMTVTPGAANKFAFIEQPTNVGYAVNMSPAVTVAIQDAQGNTTTSNSFVTLLIGTDPPTGTTLTGGNSTQAVSGIATFPGLSLNKVANGYTLVTSGSFTSATSTAFNVTSPGFVATGTAINDMVRVGDTVYFTQGAALKKVHFRGGTVGTVTSSPSGSYGRVVADATNLYWQQVGPTNANDSFIRKMAVINGTLTTLTAANTNMRSSSNSLATDGTNVYFLAQNNGATGLAIRSISVSAVSGSPTDIQGAHASDPQFMVSSGLIYFYNQTANSIGRIATSGGVVTTLVSAPQNANLFALSGTTLFIGHGDGIKSIANANSIAGPATPTTHLSGTATIRNMTLDGTNLYVNVNGDLRRYLTSNFATVTVMSALAKQSDHSILTDAIGGLYFNDTSDRIAKVIK